MSIPWQEFIDRLRSPPDDLSTLPHPDIDDPAAYSDALKDLPLLTSLYAATFTDPISEWGSKALEWTKTGQSQARIIQWASRGLSEGTFDSQVWFEALADDGNTVLREAFVQWGKDDLTSCLSACDRHFLPALRIPILTIVLEILLSVPYQPEMPRGDTAMYTLACHPFIDTVITSLILDTANHLFPLGLRTILTVIPYAPQIITTKVPSIMVVLGRAVCWRDRPFLDAGQTSDAPSTYTPPPRREWALALSANEKEIDPPLSLQSVNIVRLWLVAIYGAWPSNLLAFVRDPILYLRGKQVECPYEGDWEDVWRPGLLAARTGPLLKEFSLHSSIMYFNSDGELRDMKRWDKVDPPEHVSRAHIIAHSERLSRGKTDFFDEDDSEAPSIQPSGAATPNDNSPKPPGDDVQRLQRENLWLRLEAGYADRLRKQYLYQLGRLHKNSMRFSVDEAEVHSFANRIKEERSARDALQNELAQHRKDAAQAQQKHSKWQESLREKLTGFREEKLNWQNEAASIRTDRNNLETTALRQKAELAQVKNERFKLQNQLAEVLPKVRHIEDYEIRMKQLVDAQKLWDQDVAEHKKEMAQAEVWKGRVYQLEQLLRSVQRDVNTADPAPTPAPAPPPKAAQTKQPDLDHYIAIAEHAQKRADQFEREALELRVELDRIKREQVPSGGDRAVIWGE